MSSFKRSSALQGLVSTRGIPMLKFDTRLNSNTWGLINSGKISLVYIRLSFKLAENEKDIHGAVYHSELNNCPCEFTVKKSNKKIIYLGAVHKPRGLF